MKNNKVDEKKEEQPKIVQVIKLTILEVGEYKGFNYFLQKMGDIFQYIIFRKGQFFQSYISVKPHTQDNFTQQETVEVARVIKNFMETTVEALIKKEVMQEKLQSKKSGKKLN